MREIVPYPIKLSWEGDAVGAGAADAMATGGENSSGEVMRRVPLAEARGRKDAYGFVGNGKGFRFVHDPAGGVNVRNTTPVVAKVEVRQIWKTSRPKRTGSSGPKRMCKHGVLFLGIIVEGKSGEGVVNYPGVSVEIEPRSERLCC